MCLDYISQRNTDQPQNDDLVTDILSRSVLFYFLLFTWTCWKYPHPTDIMFT